MSSTPSVLPQTARDVRLDRNEPPLGPPPGALRRLRHALGDEHLYPVALGEQARVAVARHYRVAPERVLLTTGVDEALDVCVLELGRPRVVRPGFNGFEERASALGRPAAVTRLRDDLEVRAADLLADASPGELVAVASPGNPTGRRVADRELAELLGAGIHLFLDETYADFSGYSPGLSWLEERPQLIVFRSFSKAFGLAGLRIGCLIADAELIERLATRQPFASVDRLALHALLGALEEDADFPRHVASAVAPLRDELRAALLADGRFAAVHESCTNFVLATLPSEDAARGLCRRLAEETRVIVAWTGPFGLPEGLRISVGTPEGLARLREALALIDPEEAG